MLQGLYIHSSSMYCDTSYAKWKFRIRSLTYGEVTLCQIAPLWRNLRHKVSASVKVLNLFFPDHLLVKIALLCNKTGNKIFLKLYSVEQMMESWEKNWRLWISFTYQNHNHVKITSWTISWFLLGSLSRSWPLWNHIEREIARGGRWRAGSVTDYICTFSLLDSVA